MSPTNDRLHGLDAVRGYALLLGVVFHATMSFLPGPQVWVVADTERSLTLSGLFFVSHVFRMTTFFVIAGFFAHMMVGKKGVGGFVRDRLKRIALPLVVFWPIVITGIGLGAAYGAYLATGTVPTAPPPSGPAQAGIPFPLTHLWFLYVLLLLYAATLAVRALVRAVDRKGALAAAADVAIAGLLRTPAAPFVLALPAAVAFATTPQWLGWFGVPTPDMNLIPNLPATVEFAIAFGFGWLLNRQTGLLDHIRRWWLVNLVLAVILIAACLSILGVAPYVTPLEPGAQQTGFALAYACAIWTGTFAAIGAALRFLSDHSPARRYIADSSYWIYIIHLPVVIGLQAAVSQLAWPWGLKFALVLAVGFALMFASYQLFVRYSFIGAILNGRRAPRKGQPAVVQAEAAQ